MATKASGARDKTKVESDQLTDGAYARSGNEGTSMALAQALEESDETFDIIKQERGPTGKLQIRIQPDIGDMKTVPKGLDELVRSWGYEPNQTGVYDEPTKTPAPNHVYVK